MGDKPNDDMIRQQTIIAVDFAPRDVVLREPLPLVGTFGQCEAEVAAGFMVLVLCEKNTWGGVAPRDCGELLQRDGPSWLRNPFAPPDFWRLVDGGFAEFVGEECSSSAHRWRFTAAGLDRLRKWVPQPSAAREDVTRRRADAGTEPAEEVLAMDSNDDMVRRQTIMRGLLDDVAVARAALIQAAGRVSRARTAATTDRRLGDLCRAAESYEAAVARARTRAEWQL